MYRSLFMLSSLAAVAGSTLAGCSTSGTETDNPLAPEGIELLRSEAAYEVNPTVSEADAELLGRASLEFSVDLYRAVTDLAPAASNVLVCPYSGETVLTMLYAGARGETAAQMAGMLHINGLSEAVHPAMNALSQELGVAAGEQVTLDDYNSLWLALDLEPEVPFLDVLSTQYDSGVYRTDFSGDPEGSRRAINDWVAENTHGLIEELLEPGTVNSLTALAFTNTVYFAAPWDKPFVAERTTGAEFTLASGDTVSVDMMGGAEGLPTVIDAEYSAVSLPYAGSTISMVAVLPSEGTFDAFEASLDLERLSSIIDALDAAEENGDSASVSFPKFSFDTPIDLTPVAQSLGMIDAFSASVADFSGITGDKRLYVTDAVQKTSIAVDEAGTVAAGATAVVMNQRGIGEFISFSRPFLFYIVDEVSRTVLFAGRLMNPAEG